MSDMWGGVLEAVAGGLIGGLMRDDDTEHRQGYPTNITETITETGWKEPWAPVIPYLTGTGMLPEYLSRPIPNYNPAWLQWGDVAARGFPQGPPPPQFQFSDPNQGYGGIPQR